MKKAMLLTALILGTSVMVQAKETPLKTAASKEVSAKHPRLKKAKKAGTVKVVKAEKSTKANK